jgi:hypothetical protein
MRRAREILAAVAPTRASARSASARLAGRAVGRIEAFSLAQYLASPRASARVVLCPAGRSLASDIGFLREVSERVLWAPPGPTLAGAIEGLLGTPASAAADRSRYRRRLPGEREELPIAAAVLLEGTVTSARARALAAGDARHWIVESPRRVRVESRLMERLRKIGVRWSALVPVTVAAVFVSPRLARAHSRWKSLLPPGTPVWVGDRL